MSITARSILLPIASIILGIMFLAINEYILPSDLLIAAADLFLPAGCLILAVHPFIGRDSYRRKIVESIASIIAAFFVRAIILSLQIEEWNPVQINYKAIVLAIISLGALALSIIEEQNIMEEKLKSEKSNNDA